MKKQRKVGKRGPYHRWVPGTKGGKKGTFCIHCSAELARFIGPCKKKG